MFVVAKSAKGHEYMYSAKSAHMVSKTSAKYICEKLNELKYGLKDGEVWFIHEVGPYDSAYDYGEIQKFTQRKGIIKRVARYGLF